MSVWQKQKNWWNEVLWKPKKALSLDQLKFQHHMLLKNPMVTDHNKQLLVETFRSIAEILIWGDQNDSRVFDFFLEKNMQAFFLKILTQKCGHYVCVQLLQTLNILFENIRNDTSIYYLLSNNHINSIIVLKLDFSDEEVLAYYISFLKTLSFHLNNHTIHFFYNEHLHDFPLYTEAIKFFKHSENMVRIAVRTLTLNVYKVDDKATLEYICSNSAAPYFSNMAWFIGNHVIELDECLISQAHHLNRGRLEQLVAEHLDHLHYIADIYSLEAQCLNDILSDHLLNRLLIPLYIYSLVDESSIETEEKGPRISSMVSLFLLSQVFLILSHPSLVTPLAYLLFTGDTDLTLPPVLQGHKRGNSYNSVCAFVRPENSLETSLVRHSSLAHANPIAMDSRGGGGGGGRGKARGKSSISLDSQQASFASQNSVEGYVDTVVDDQYVVIEASPSGSSSQSSQPISSSQSPCSPGSSIRSPQQQMSRLTPSSPKKVSASKSPLDSDHHHGIPIINHQFLDSLMSSLIIQHDDSRCLFGLSILYAMLKNDGIHHKLLEAFSLRPKGKKDNEEGSPQYNSELVALLLSILDSCTTASNSIRLITLRLAIMLLTELLAGGTMGEEGNSTKTPAVGGADVDVKSEGDWFPVMQDHHIALVEHIYESAIFRLRMFYNGPQDEIFLDMFEDEFEKEKSFKLKVSFMMMDESMLLPPTNTPLTGIDFTRRLPCGENEKARKTMRVFFAMRRLSQRMSGTKEDMLPLTIVENSAKMEDVVDLSNCDLVACKMVVAEKITNHFMVFNETEFLLVDPHKSKLGCGVVHFIAFLQDIDISGDPADTHSLFVVVHSRNSAQKRPKLSGRFIFEDHIRCIAARSVFQRARDSLHHTKMTSIAKMLHLPVPESPSAVPVTDARQKQYVDATPPTLTSTTPITPTISVPETPPFSLSPRISSSVLQDTFRGVSPVNSSAPSQEIELSALSTSEKARRLARLGDEVPDFDTPVRLTLPAPLYFADADVKYRDGRMSRDMSLTPEPSSRSSTDCEEGLTASGGLFKYHELSDLFGFDESVGAGMLDISGDKEEEGVCPLGVGLGTVVDRLEATGESVISLHREQHSTETTPFTEHAQKDIRYSQEGVVNKPPTENAWDGVTDMERDSDMLDTRPAGCSQDDEGGSVSLAEEAPRSRVDDVILGIAAPCDLGTVCTDKKSDATQPGAPQGHMILGSAAPCDSADRKADSETQNSQEDDIILGIATPCDLGAEAAQPSDYSGRNDTEHVLVLTDQHVLLPEDSGHEVVSSQTELEHHTENLQSISTEQRDTERTLEDTEHAQTVSVVEHGLIDSSSAQTISGLVDAQTVTKRELSTEHPQISDVKPTVDSSFHVVEPSFVPERTDSSPLIWSSKSASSTAADVTTTLDTDRVIAETGERTPPALTNSQLDSMTEPDT